MQVDQVDLDIFFFFFFRFLETPRFNGLFVVDFVIH